MAWTVLLTGEVDTWIDSLDQGSQDAIFADIGVLQQEGPQLGRPYVDTLADSRISNLKELRTHHGHHQYRIAFAFDPKQQAILLLGGDKTGANQKRFYQDLIKQAERLYSGHLAALKAKGAKNARK
jgi:hypothetical protein